MRRPQAVFNRCMWWRGLSNWPNGTDENDQSACIERAFGRTSQADGHRIAEAEGLDLKAGNDIPAQTLFIIAIGIAAYLLYKKYA